MRSLSYGSAWFEHGMLGRATTRLGLLTVLGIVAIASAAPAAADSGGGVRPPVSVKPKTKKQSKTKLLPAAAKPRTARLADVRCAANPDGPCLDAHRAERGATLQLRGRNLSTVKQVVFYGAKGAADDALAPVQAPQATRALTTVPAHALTGPIAVIDSAGRRSSRWDGLIVDIPQSFSFRPASSVPSVQVGLSQPRTIFFGGMQKAIFNLQVTGARPVDVRIDLVRLTDSVIVRSWQRPRSSPGVTQRVTWNGAVRGRPQRQGRYAFRVTVPSAVGARAEPPIPDDRDAITLMGYVFPVRGAHQFGTGAARFGAARRGHRHQGQDTFARCGTPLVAARGGKVTYAGYHALAGYYVVIDGAGTGVDYMYAHLRQPALVATGDTVYTGQQIGEVGDTGDAVGCHLHFEEWTAPGWYKGGHPYDPLADLKRWDAGLQ